MQPSLSEIAEKMIQVKSHVYLQQTESPYFLSEFCDLLLYDAIVRAGDARIVIHRLLNGKKFLPRPLEPKNKGLWS